MKKLLLTYIASTVLIVLFWFLFLISPQVNSRREFRAAYSEAQIKLTDFRKTMLEFPERFSSVKEINHRRLLLESQLFSKEDLLRLFGNLREKAAESNLSLLEITPSIEELLAMNKQPLQDEFPRPLDISVRLNGPFPDIGEYIKLIEGEKYFEGINSCKVISTADGNASPSVDFGFKVVLGSMEKI